jgi:redox-sensitive bicupin YhaK (pirin superfamily)
VSLSAFGLGFSLNDSLAPGYFQGEIEHADSTGMSDTIREGDVQWMTAGRGIIHEEFMSTEFSSTGGSLEMCQLWLNLPKLHKMSPPGYQAITQRDIPRVALSAEGEADGYVRVVAGDYNGTVGAATTFTPVNLWDIVLPTPGKAFTLSIPAGHNSILFVRRGSIQVSPGRVCH